MPGIFVFDIFCFVSFAENPHHRIYSHSKSSTGQKPGHDMEPWWRHSALVIFTDRVHLELRPGLTGGWLAPWLPGHLIDMTMTLKLEQAAIKTTIMTLFQGRGSNSPHICGLLGKGTAPKHFWETTLATNYLKWCQDTSVQSHDSASQLCFRHHISPSFSESFCKFPNLHPNRTA